MIRSIGALKKMETDDIIEEAEQLIKQYADIVHRVELDIGNNKDLEDYIYDIMIDVYTQGVRDGINLFIGEEDESN